MAQNTQKGTLNESIIASEQYIGVIDDTPMYEIVADMTGIKNDDVIIQQYEESITIEYEVNGEEYECTFVTPVQSGKTASAKFINGILTIQTELEQEPELN